MQRKATLLLILGLWATSALVNAQSADKEIARYLHEIEQLTLNAIEASKAAEKASSVAAVKEQADAVFAAVWGQPSGLSDGSTGAAHSHDWKSRWQTDVEDFELEDPPKFGTEPAAFTDPGDMGIVGRGRFVRKLLWEQETEGNPHVNHVLHSLNNVIGWQKMDYAPARGGMPRVDLTAQWDAPSDFWLSTADTGWINEAYTQAMNILKTDYGSDLNEARQHAASMTQLLEKALNGEDANGNGNVEPSMMEGGVNTFMTHARLAGFSLL